MKKTYFFPSRTAIVFTFFIKRGRPRAKNGMKTLYYLRSEAIKRAEIVSDKVLREYLFDYEDDCLACEG